MTDFAHFSRPGENDPYAYHLISFVHLFSSLLGLPDGNISQLTHCDFDILRDIVMQNNALRQFYLTGSRKTKFKIPRILKPLPFL